MIRDYRGKAVLVTGGTSGIGLATALAFARQGARCTLTYRWGSADEEELCRKFAALDAPAPRIVQADASNPEDGRAVLEMMKASGEPLEAFISNAASALIIKGFEDYSSRGFKKSLDTCTWPLVDYLRQIRSTFGAYPRYVIAMSSPGHEHYAPRYDFVAASKAVLETLCRYLSYRLRDEDVRVNVVRASAVRTPSLEATFGREVVDFFNEHGFDEHFVTPEEVAETTLALCSGLLDAMRGQVITVDRGFVFSDNVVRLYGEREDRRL